MGENASPDVKTHQIKTGLEIRPALQCSASDLRNNGDPPSRGILHAFKEGKWAKQKRMLTPHVNLTS